MMRKTSLALSISACLMTLTSFTALSTSYAPDPRDIAVSAQASAAVDRFYFSEELYAGESLTTTPVLFYYTQSAVDLLGSVKNVHTYIENSVALNNAAFAHGGVALQRKVMAVLPALDFDDQMSPEVMLSDFTAYLADDDRDNNYVQAHTALLFGYDADVHGSVIGTGWLGGSKVVFGAQDSATAGSTTLAHELSHNDGNLHDLANSFDSYGNPVEALNEAGYGDTCRGFGSIMSYVGTRNVPFFSSPYIYVDVDTENETPCGVAGVTDVTGVYQKLLAEQAFEGYTMPVSGSVSFGDVGYSDDGRALVVEVIFSSGVAEMSSVELYTEDGTMFAGEDYAETYVRVSYLGDGLTQTVEVPLLGDISDGQFYLGIKQGYLIESVPDEMLLVDGGAIGGLSERGTVKFSGEAEHFFASGVGTYVLEREGGTDGELSVELTVSGDAGLIIETNPVVFEDGQDAAEVTVRYEGESLADVGYAAFELAMTDTYWASDAYEPVEVLVFDDSWEFALTREGIEEAVYDAEEIGGDGDADDAEEIGSGNGDSEPAEGVGGTGDGGDSAQTTEGGGAAGFISLLVLPLIVWRRLGRHSQ